jgi:hypothetical protein
MLICFFDIRSIIHFKYVSEGNTVNWTFHVEVLKRLIDAVRGKREELWRNCSLILLHNAMVQSSLKSVTVFSR